MYIVAGVVRSFVFSLLSVCRGQANLRTFTLSTCSLIAELAEVEEGRYYMHTASLGRRDGLISADQDIWPYPTMSYVFSRTFETAKSNCYE